MSYDPYGIPWHEDVERERVEAERKREEFETNKRLPQRNTFVSPMMGAMRRGGGAGPIGYKGMLSSPPVVAGSSKQSQKELRKTDGITDPLFRSMYDIKLKTMSKIAHSQTKDSPILDAMVSRMPFMGLIDLLGMTGIKGGDLVPPLAFAEFGTKAKNRFDRGDYSGSAMAGGEAALEATSFGPAARAGVKGARAFDKYVQNAPSMMDDVGDVFAGAAVNRSIGAELANSSMVNYPKSRTWDKPSEKLYNATKKKHPDMPESELLTKTGTYTTPDGRTIQLIGDDLKVKSHAVPPPEAVLAMEHDKAIVDKWDALRGDDLDMPWKEFTAKHGDLFKSKQEADARLYKYSLDYGNTQTSRVDEAFSNSAALDAFPELGGNDFISKRKAEGQFTGYYKGGEMMLSGTDDVKRTALGRHEGEHMIQDYMGAPRGGNVTEMRNYQQDLADRMTGIAESLRRSSRLKDEALAKGDAKSAAEHDKDYKDLMSKRQALVPHAQATPFDLYQSLRGEVEARYAQLGLSTEQMKTYPLEDFVKDEEIRTGVKTLYIGQNERLDADGNYIDEDFEAMSGVQGWHVTPSKFDEWEEGIGVAGNKAKDWGFARGLTEKDQPNYIMFNESAFLPQKLNEADLDADEIQKAINKMVNSKYKWHQRGYR